MRILIEAHHPAHIHFWKYPVRELIAKGHDVLMVGRDRDVMRRLLEVYDWIPYTIPAQDSRKNTFPLKQFLRRQWTMLSHIRSFCPDVVASLMGSYTQTAKIFGVRNVIFTDSEFQHFNHRIAHPFCDEIYTPECFYKNLGRKQRTYPGIHEWAFLHPDYFRPDPSILHNYDGLDPGHYIVIRLSAWNTLHDCGQGGIGNRIFGFVEKFSPSFRLVVSAEEGKLPPGLEDFALDIEPEDFHQFLAHAAFVLTEGASTASEAACLGIPTVYINSTEPRGYLLMLEQEFRTIRSFQEPERGMIVANQWLESIDNLGYSLGTQKINNTYFDLTSHVVKVLEN